MKTFETYVQEQCPGEYATNNSPEGFERWLEQLDVQEVMDMAEAYGKDVEQEVVQRVRAQIKEMEILSFMGMDIVARVPDSNRMDKVQTNKVLSYAKKTINELINAPFRPSQDKSTDKILEDFIRKFCNDHNGEIRFLRSVFYDKKDGAEQIIAFLTTSITQALAEERSMAWEGEAVKQAYIQGKSHGISEEYERVRGIIEKELKLLSSAYAGLETLPEKSANLAIRDSFIRIQTINQINKNI